MTLKLKLKHNSLFEVSNRFTGVVVAYDTKGKVREARDKHGLACGSYAHTIKPPIADPCR